MPCPALLLTLDALREAAVLFDGKGDVLHGNKAAEQLFGWNVREQQGSGSSGGEGSPPKDHGVSTMLAFPQQQQAQQDSTAANGGAGSGSGSSASPVPVTGTVRMTPSSPPSGGQPSLTFNPETQQEAWVNILSSLPPQKICRRDGVGFRLEAAGAGIESVSFPVTVNLLKLSDGAFVPTPQADATTTIAAAAHEETYVCAFVTELAHAADQWPRQHREMSSVGLDLEVELRLKHSLTLSIVEASFDAMFYINEKGIINMVNKAAIEQFGWTRNEFLGSNISMICGGGRAPNHDNYIKRYLRTGEKRVMGKKRELRARRRDGSEFPIELGLTEVKVRKGEERSFCGFIRDLSKEKEQQMEVRHKQRMTEGIIDAAFDPMFAINEKGIILMVNEAAVTQLGFKREEMMGSNISIIVGGGHAANHDEYIQRYLRTGEKRVMGMRRELPARRADGSEFWIELGLTEVTTEDGEERFFTGFLRDLSAIKQKQRLTAGIIDASFDPVFAINENGIINMVNEAAVKQFGWTEDEMVGSNISIIVGGGHAKNHDEYLKRYLRTGEKRVMGVRRELSARRADGSEFPIELGLAEIKVSDGEEREFVGCFTLLRMRAMLAVRSRFISILC